MHLDVEQGLFVAMIWRWLRLPFADEETYCPQCGGILDIHGDHALVCPCGGDRTRRHNLLRNLVFHVARSAGLQPELERPGLLPPRPLCSGAPEDGSKDTSQESSSRRPADIYIPRWRLGPSCAWDFAVTSGLRPDMVAASSRDCGAACRSYEDHKRGYLDTHRQCTQQGLGFVPLVVEAVGGGWGKEARKIWSELAKSMALAQGELTSNSECGASLVQRLSIMLHKENARAVLRRFGHGGVCPDKHVSSIAATVMEA